MFVEKLGKTDNYLEITQIGLDGERQISISPLRLYLTPVRMAKVNETIEADDGETLGREEHLCMVGIGPMEKRVMFSPKVEN